MSVTKKLIYKKSHPFLDELQALLKKYDASIEGWFSGNGDGGFSVKVEDKKVEDFAYYSILNKDMLKPIVCITYTNKS
jgi:hypothetical protein